MRNNSLLLLSLLAACSPSLSVSHVDPELRPILDSLVRDLTALGYPDLLVETPAGGVHLVADTYRVQRRIDETGKLTTGFFDPSTDEIVLPGVDEPLSLGRNSWRLFASGLKLVLAHELGHAFGLEHSDRGLMTSSLNYAECGNRPAECLIEALDLPARLN